MKNKIYFIISITAGIVLSFLNLFRNKQSRVEDKKYDELAKRINELDHKYLSSRDMND